MLKASELIKNNCLPEKESGLYCLIGQAEDGAVHFCDILKAPHILVGGCTGSGKSVLLRGVVLSLIMNYTPDEVGLILLDTKEHAEFVVYDNLPHLVGTGLKVVEEEMERRFNVWEIGKQYKPLVVMIDEYAELSYNKEKKEVVERLLKFGHGVGIHVMLATQRVTKDVITPIMKAQLTTILTCRLADKRDSKFVLGEYGAEKLLGNGDMLYKDSGGNIMRVQSGYVGNQDVQGIVQNIIEKYKK
jgi:S-DNA-T family DNA segregation ATPase FtsK/SpoIIIE